MGGVNAEYGRGAQNLSQAVKAMTRPLPTDGAPPTGRSERLGNVIDSWYFASLGPLVRQEPRFQKHVGPRIASLVAMSCGIAPSFAKFLASRLGHISASRAQAELAIVEKDKHDSWGLYAYPTIRMLMPAVRHDLRAAMRQYAERYDPSLSQQRYEGGPSHLVVHYRVGDFVTQRWCVPPADVAAAAGALQPSIVELMDGGSRHLDQIDGWRAAPHRANRSRLSQANHMNVEVQRRLEAALRAAAPAAKIVRHAPGSIDADWFRAAHAPMLVTGAGSFAVTAAVAGHGHAVRTPAAANLNFPDRSVRAEEQMADNWRTFAYDRRAMQGRRL